MKAKDIAYELINEYENAIPVSVCLMRAKGVSSGHLRKCLNMMGWFQNKELKAYYYDVDKHQAKKNKIAAMPTLQKWQHCKTGVVERGRVDTSIFKRDSWDNPLHDANKRLRERCEEIRRVDNKYGTSYELYRYNQHKAYTYVKEFYTLPDALRYAGIEANNRRHDGVGMGLILSGEGHW